MKKLILLIAVLISTQLSAQYKAYKDISIDQFLTETQLGSDDPDSLELIWWIPLDFWEISNAQDPSYTEGDMQELREMLAGYEIFAVVKGRIGTFGGITYSSLETIQEEFKVMYKGEPLVLADTGQAPPDLLNFMSMIQPMMANMFGPMGENMHFILMKDNALNKVIPISAKADDDVAFELGAFKKSIDLPLSCMMIEKKCPKDGKLYNGKFNYCPYDGTALKQQ